MLSDLLSCQKVMLTLGIEDQVIHLHAKDNNHEFIMNLACPTLVGDMALTQNSMCNSFKPISQSCDLDLGSWWSSVVHETPPC